MNMKSRLDSYKELYFQAYSHTFYISIVNIVSLYTLKNNNKKKFADFKIFFRGFFKFYENRKFCWRQSFEIFIIHNLSWGHVRSLKNLGPISSAVLTFIGYKQTISKADI